MEKKGTVVLAAGGTGGHLFPAEALGAELRTRGYDVHLAVDFRAKRFVSNFDESHIHEINSATIGGKNPIALMKTLWALLKGVRQSRQLFKVLKPKLVVGFGGYPTLPPLYAAAKKHIPTLIHEQNGVMGRANKALAARVSAIAGGFLTSAGKFNDKLIITGNPVRLAVREAAKIPYQESKDAAPFHLLVFGGSQGASFFSEITPDAVKLLPENLKKRLRIVQQARDDVDGLRAEYQDMGVQVELAPFFSDMATRIAAAQFIIARSGASTVSEIAAIGRPALLVPYPYALDHDQAANAATLAQTGGVKVVSQYELDPTRLATILKRAMENPSMLATEAAAAKQAGCLDATQKLADLAEALIAGRSLKDIKEENAHENAA